MWNFGVYSDKIQDAISESAGGITVGREVIVREPHSHYTRHDALGTPGTAAAAPDIFNISSVHNISRRFRNITNIPCS